MKLYDGAKRLFGALAGITLTGLAAASGLVLVLTAEDTGGSEGSMEFDDAHKLLVEASLKTRGARNLTLLTTERLALYGSTREAIEVELRSGQDWYIRSEEGSAIHESLYRNGVLYARFRGYSPWAPVGGGEVASRPPAGQLQNGTHYSGFEGLTVTGVSETTESGHRVLHVYGEFLPLAFDPSLDDAAARGTTEIWIDLDRSVLERQEIRSIFHRSGQEVASRSITREISVEEGTVPLPDPAPTN